MLSIRIDDENTTVTNSTCQTQWTNKTSELFGIIYVSQLKHYPDFDCDKFGDRVVERISKGLQGQAVEEPTYLFGMVERGDTLFFMEQFIDGRRMVSPTIDDIEELRISNRMTANFLPSHGCIQFDKLNSVRHVIIALLYFYAVNGYKLTICKHCGRWFATKSLKELYCSKNSSFPGYERYTCGEAVKRIKDKLERKRLSEYERLHLKAMEYGVNSRHSEVFNSFCQTCSTFKAELKHGASVELLQAYKDYLYDSENVRPKYERIKNW